MNSKPANDLFLGEIVSLILNILQIQVALRTFSFSYTFLSEFVRKGGKSMRSEHIFISVETENMSKMILIILILGGEKMDLDIAVAITSHNR